MKLGSMKLTYLKNKQNASNHQQLRVNQAENNAFNDQPEEFNLRQFIVNQNQLNNLFRTFLEHNLGPNAVPKAAQNSKKNEDYLCISNFQTKQRMTHGQQFKQLLDPRDRVLQHDFHFAIKIDFEGIKEKGFLKSDTYSQIVAKIKQFMVETLANILSVSFKYLNDNQLEQKQVKNYAASNMMLNVQSIFSKTIQAIQGSEKLKEMAIDVQKTKVDLIQALESMIKNILINQAAYYPQAPITGGTLRMNSVINEVNRVDDEQNDLIYSNGIVISRYMRYYQASVGSSSEYQRLDLRQDEDYTDFIMEVVNTAIRVVQTSEGDSQQRVNKEVFTEFNKELFAMSQVQSFKSLIQTATNGSNHQEVKKNLKQTTKMQEEQEQKQALKKVEMKAAKESISSYFERVTQTNGQKLRRVKNSIQTNPMCQEVNKVRQKSLQSLKDYAIGFKIPNYVKPFSRQQMAEKQFRARHSSILRILTKWADYLQDIFINAQKQIMRVYAFKDIHNNLINITDRQIKQQIIKSLKFTYAQVENKLEEVKAKNRDLISQILNQNKGPLPYSVYRFAQTRQVSSKINAALTSLMVDYLSVLIHHLIQAGKDISHPTTYQTIGNLNFIVFKVSDLMRAKFKCSESSFITLLKTMYLLDQSKAMKGKFKLVRIKNKLEDSANNIMVNYLFMGKVQCELQLSIQESKGKEKNYYIFSHFIYELIRGKLGIISQCAIMISQLDPIANSCEQIYYEQKEQKERKPFVKNITGRYQSFYKPKAATTNIFYCSSCKKLVIKEESKLFEKVEGKHICMKCLFTQKDSQLKIDKTNFELKDQLLQSIQQKKLVRIINYHHKILDERLHFYLRINSMGKMECGVVIFLFSELKLFYIKVSPEILKKVEKDQKSVNFSEEIDYYNIFKFYKNKKEITDHFLFEVKDPSTLNKFLSKMEFDVKVFQEQLMIFLKLFSGFRKEKNLIKSIKFKAEVLIFNGDKQKWQSFNKILKIYSTQDNRKREQLIKEELKYRKYNQLEFNKIKVIEAFSGAAGSDNHNLSVCNNLEQIKLGYNHIESTTFLENITELRDLQLAENKIKSIDGLKDLIALTNLNLSYNRLTAVDELRNITTIDNLYLNNNRLQNIDGLQNLMTVKEIRLQCNRLKNVNSLKNITKASKINIKQNPLLENVDGLSKLTSVNQLDLFECKLNNVDGLKNVAVIDKLILCYNKLESIAGLISITSLTELKLTHNKTLKNVDGLGNLTTAQLLNLQYNKLLNVDGLAKLTSASKLYLNNNQLENIDGLKSLTTVDELLLNVNKLTNVDGLTKVTALKKLQLENNQLQNIDGLTNLNAVNHLQLQNNQLKNVDGLRNVATQLTLLDLNTNQLQSIDGLHNLTSIVMLDLSRNPPLTNLNGLRNLKAIKELNASRCSIQNVDGLENLTSIDKLVLSENPLTSIQGLRNITTGKWIKIEKTNLQNIDGLRNITTAQQLVLSDNQLKNIDGLSKITSIFVLYLDRNQLENVDSLSNLTKLEHLHLSQNRITNLDGLKNIQRVTTLILWQNQLQNVDGLRHMTEIIQLYLQHNQLQNVDGLTNILIHTLFLNNNKLKHVDGLRSMERLQILKLHHNQLLNLDGLNKALTMKYLSLYDNSQLVITQLPTVNQVIKVNHHQVTTYDFSSQPMLRSLQSDQQNRQVYKNLSSNTNLDEINPYR